MSDKVDEMILFLCYIADKLLQPTFRNLTESYESWEFRNCRRFMFQRLYKRGWIEVRGLGPDRSVALSGRGRLAAMGGIDPNQGWGQPWDGAWKLVVFDVPAEEPATRKRMLHWLHRHRFGCLQFSTWIHSRLPQSIPSGLLAHQRGCGFLTVLDARSRDGWSPGQIAECAWDFREIDGRYEAYLTRCREEWAPMLAAAREAKEAMPLLREERTAWLEASAKDPFLPECLWPKGYLGREAWGHHARFYGVASAKS